MRLTLTKPDTKINRKNYFLIPTKENIEKKSTVQNTDNHGFKIIKQDISKKWIKSRK
jgi:hypothetical protein